MSEAQSKLTALLLFGALGLSACGSSATPRIPASATVQQAAGSFAGRIVLTRVGAQRIGIQTGVVKPVPGAPTVIIPYSSVIYAPDGSTYAFTNPSPLVFTEVPITIDNITGSSAYLLKGPPAGTRVVTVGAEELFGVQTGVLPQT